MALSKEEISGLRLLLQEELEAKIMPFRNEVNRRFDVVTSQIDGLYQRDVKREQEYLAMRGQAQRLERKFV